MKILQSFISEELIHAIGWTLIHSIWQGALIAIVMSVLFMGIKDKSAKLRYLGANMALLLVLILAVLTFVDLYQSVTPEESLIFISQSIVDGGAIIQIENETAALNVSSFINGNIGLITGAWILGFLFFGIKLIGGLAHIEFLKRSKLEIPFIWKEKLNALKGKINYEKEIELALSSAVSVPVVLGALKPIILLPIGMINKMNPEEVESILAHELSHIVRQDYLFNVIQSVVESLLYFNPGVWWISAVLRSERENCCDDLAIEMCGDSVTYARALVGVEEFYHKTPTLAMGLFKEKKSLLKRVKRILKQPQNKSVLNEKLLVSSLLVLGLCFIGLESNIAKDNLNKTTIEIDENNFSEFIPPPVPPAPPAPPVPPVQLFKGFPEIPSPPAFSKFPSGIKENEFLKKKDKFEHFNSLKKFKNNSFQKFDHKSKAANFLKTSKDTIPSTNDDVNISIKSGANSDSEFKLIVEDGEVKELIIDGEKIDEADFEEYIENGDINIGNVRYPNSKDEDEFRKKIELQIEEAHSLLEEAKIKSLEQLKSIDIEEENWKERVEEQIRESEERRVEILEQIEDQIESFDAESNFNSDELSAHIEESLASVQEAFADIDMDLLSIIEDLDIDFDETERTHLHYLKQWLIDDLMHHGYIENENEYDISLTKDGMIVNGKKMSQKETDRYIEEIEEINKKDWKRKNKLILKKNDSWEKSKLKFNGSFSTEWERI